MLRKRFVFNIIGERELVDKASIEIKDIISGLKNEPVDIIMEDKDTIFHKMNTNNKNCTYWEACRNYFFTTPRVMRTDLRTSQTRYNINKYYIENDDINSHSDKIIDLSRYIRSMTRDTIHPWNLHVEYVDSLYVSDFMKKCSQINCVYPLNAVKSDKQKNIELFLIE